MDTDKLKLIVARGAINSCFHFKEETESKNCFLRIALITLLFVCQATWTLAGTTGSVSDTITDQNGRPLGGASVTVRSPSRSKS